MELAIDVREIDTDKVANIAETGSHEWRVFAAAKMYIAAGFNVLPIRKNQKILPGKEHNVSYGSASKSPKTIDKWFGPGGSFEGWNIGIACGKTNGTFVIDVDRHGITDGLRELADLEEEHGNLPEVPIQKTPTEGRHYLLRWQENATNSTGKIAKSIDTRGGTENACKGHIVAWPSIVNGKTYEWIRGGNRGDIPKWVMDLMGVPWKKRGTGRGNENVADEDLEQQVGLDQIRGMLDKIDPNDLDYDTWLRIGMSIKSQHPGEDGSAAWDEWSSQGNRYESNECHIRWSGLDELGAVRIGTLFHHAKEAGWVPSKEAEDKHSNPLKDLVHEMNEEYAILVTGGKLKMLREKKGEYDPVFGHYELIEKEAFRGMLHPFKVQVVNATGKVVMVSKADIWLGDVERRSYPNGLECRPDGKIRPGIYNTWSGFSVEPIPGDCSLFLEHVRDIICREDEEHYKWLMDWCAFTVQHPGDLPGSCVVMRGEEGTGKGTLADTMGRFFGPHYRHLIDNAHLLSNFNAHMMDACFVFADEITYGGEMKTSGKLKGMVTEEYLVGERKGIDAVGYKNMIHLMIASNSDWVIPAGAKSRRWFMLDVSNKRANDKVYFDELNKQLDNGGREALMHLLLTRNITSNLRKAPRTKTLDEQTSRTLSTYNTVIRWWTRKILEEKLDSMDIKTFDPSDSNGNDWPSLVKTSDMLNEYNNWCIERRINPVSDYVFYGDLKKYGFRSTRPTMNGVRIRASVVPDITAAKKIMDDLGIVMFEDEEDEDD